MVGGLRAACAALVLAVTAVVTPTAAAATVPSRADRGERIVRPYEPSAERAPRIGEYQPWSETELADPHVTRVGGTYHVYGTHFFPFCAEQHVPHWQVAATARGAPGAVLTWVGDALPTMPSWAKVFPGSVCGVPHHQVWAPAVEHFPGYGYRLFFTARHVNEMMCIGVATASTPDGPFTAQSTPLQCETNYWNIDPWVVFASGIPYLLWRGDEAGQYVGVIRSRPLAANGLAWRSGSARTTILTGSLAWEEGFPGATHPGIGPIENPSMVYLPDSGRWLLAWSGHLWNTNEYATGLAQCSGPSGPCTKVTTSRPWVRRDDDTPYIDTSAVFGGAGGLSFVRSESGKLYAAFAAWRDRDTGGYRRTWVYAVVVRSRYLLREIARA